jgi:hypothetical protein
MGNGGNCMEIKDVICSMEENEDIFIVTQDVIEECIDEAIDKYEIATE